MLMKDAVTVDILICGGGSAGFGAAYQACKQGNGQYTVAVIDSNKILGGASTAGGVNAWEMGIGGPGIHTELSKRLLVNDNKAAILKGYWETLTRTRPYAIASITKDYVYEDTLKAAGIYDRENNLYRFMFEPTAMADEMLTILEEVGSNNFTFYNSETVTRIITEDNKIQQVITDKHIFSPRTVIDCTGDIEVAKMAGCKTQLGIENSSSKINGVTQVYRVEKKPYSSIDIVPQQYRSPYSDKPFEQRLNNVRVISSINAYPNGDLNINPLPTMGGDEFFAMNKEQALDICRGRVYLHWRRMQQDSPDMRNYRIKEIFPMIGIRESYRLQGRYVLTEEDILSGLENQNRKEELIAFSDHPVDVHGGDNPGIKILSKPYGIPYSCLLPQYITNLIVACRGSSFGSIAAASCRLSRTMIALGEAAGTAAAVCLDSKKQPRDADVSKIRDILEIPEFTKMLKREFGL